MEWVVSLEADVPGPFSAELGDRLIDELQEYSPAVGGREGRMGVTMSVEAATDRQAFDRARTALFRGLGRGTRIVDVRVQTVAELERELEAPSVPALAGIREIAEVLGVSRQRASELASSSGFPKPVANLAAGPVWLYATIRSFNEGWERRTGRPPARRTKPQKL
jgi:hypothetical protein